MPDGDIELAFDRESQGYWVIWRPTVIGWGVTKQEAVADLTAAARLSLDCVLGSKPGADEETSAEEQQGQ
jgi:hypothetical protein